MASGQCKHLLAGCVLLAALPVTAQWVTETVELDAGWNAVFLHVDSSHLELDSWIGSDTNNPITQIWRWSPPDSVQFVDAPQNPIQPVSGWVNWVRNDPESALHLLAGDTAYLVESASAYTWSVKGRPVPPRREWNGDGLNLLGFPTVPVNPPKFDAFIAQASELQAQEVEIYRYAGLVLDSTNPARIFPSLYRASSVVRGEAFWIRSGTVFNRYFGPFEVVLSGSDGIQFYERLSIGSLRLRNYSPNPLTVSMELLASEAVPSGQPAIAGIPPLLVRGSLDFATQSYGYSELPVGALNAQSWTLAPRDEEGSEVEVVLGFDRSVITEPEGSLLAGILRITDSIGHSRIDVPVSGTVGSQTGLWVGEALVTQVGQYLKTYQDGAVAPIVTTNGSTVVTNDLVIATNGNYVITNVVTDLADVPTWYPLRLIVHNPTPVAPVLLQRVFFGMNTQSNLALSKQENVLDPDHLDSARRISATHLPWTEDNNGWTFNGPLDQGSIITASVFNHFTDQRSNPFLHTYHPDHDNLDAPFKTELAQGSESYTLERDIRIEVNPPGTNFFSRISGGETLTGDYYEDLRVIGLARAGGTNDTRALQVRGVFRLDRISEISTLTENP